MSKRNEIYDISTELSREFGEIGTEKRKEAVTKGGIQCTDFIRRSQKCKIDTRRTCKTHRS